MSGVMKAGGAFVPRSPFHPSEHLRTIVQDVRARLVLADTDAAGLFDATVDRFFVVPATDMSATGIADDFLVVVVKEEVVHLRGHRNPKRRCDGARRSERQYETPGCSLRICEGFTSFPILLLHFRRSKP